MRGLKWTKRKSPSQIILYSLVSLLFLAVSLSYIYILVWSFISGCKTHTEIVMNPFSLPEEWHFEHYIEVFKTFEINGKGFLSMFANSVWFSVMDALLLQFTACTLAYACSKYKFKGSGLVYTITLIIITLPIYGNSGAVYELYANLGVIDSYAQVITSASGFNMMFLYYMAFFKNLSWTYAEAAMMDGAGHFQIYFKVMLPQARAIFGALFLTRWIKVWNSYEAHLVYLPNLPTLPVGVYQFNMEMMYRARLDILFAACIIIVIPALILFIVFNKTITSNVSVGGIKG